MKRLRNWKVLVKRMNVHLENQSQIKHLQCLHIKHLQYSNSKEI